MKILIVYYSLDGSCKLVAEEINKSVNAEILELQTENVEKPKGILERITAMFNKNPKLKPLEKDIDSYDFIFLGTPVWSWNYAPILKAFFSENIIKNKKLALFCCSSGKKGKALENMKKKLSESEVMGEMEFIKPLKENREYIKQEVGNWVDNVLETF